MFDIGLGELLVVGFAALILLGPKRCGDFFKEIGKLMRKFEAEWRGMLE